MPAPPPISEPWLDPAAAWELVLAEARQRVGEVFASAARGKRYRVASAEPERVVVERIDADAPETLSPGEVRRAVEKLNAAGWRVPRRGLHYTVAKETALVWLHPAIEWEGDEIVAHPDRQDHPGTASEAVDLLTRHQILRAIAALDSGAETAFAESTTYDVLHEGRRYAPLRVVALAAELLLGRPLQPHSAGADSAVVIKGGLGSPAFRALERCGFDIAKKGATVDASHPDEIVPISSRSEGGRTRVWVNRYERDPKLRDACIDHYGTVCQVCEVDMAETYGELGAGYVHVHHLRPLAAGDERETDPERDLVPVCPNCHAMLHRGRPADDPRSVEDLRAALRSTRVG